MHTQRQFGAMLLGLAALALLLGGTERASAGTLTTTYAFGATSNLGDQFDVTTGSNPLLVTGLDVNFNQEPSGVGGPYTVNVYTHTGTFAPGGTPDENPADWTLVSTTTGVVSNGRGTGSPVAITPFTLGANSTTGLYITATGGFGLASVIGGWNSGDPGYIAPTPPDYIPPAYILPTSTESTLASNSDLTIDMGVGTGSLFGGVNDTGAPSSFSSFPFPIDPTTGGRAFEGEIFYDVIPTVPEPTSLALFGLGGVALAAWRVRRKKCAA